MNQFTPRFYNEDDVQPTSPSRVIRMLYRVAVLLVAFAIGVLALSGLLLLCSPNNIAQVLAEPILTVVFLPALFFILWLLFATFWFGVAAWRHKRWVVVPLVLVAFALLLASGQQVFRYYEYFGVGTIVVGLVSLTLVIFCLWYVRRNWTLFTGKIRRLRVQIPLVLLTIGFTAPLLANLIYTDRPPVDDSDLTLPIASPLAKEDNVYYGLPRPSEAGQEVERSVEAMRVLASDQGFPANIDSADTESLVRTTTPLVEQVVSAVNREGYQCPNTLNNYSMEARSCDLNAHRDLAQVVAVHAVVALESGETAAAVTYALTIIQLADKLEDNPTPNSIDILVVTAVRDIGYSTLGTVLDALDAESNGSDREARVRIAAALQANQPDRVGSVRAVKVQYLGYKELIQNLGQQNQLELPSVPSSYIWHPNRTVAELATIARLKIANIQGPCGGETASAEFQGLERRVQEHTNQSIPLTLFQPNAIGSILLRIVIASEAGVLARVCETEIQHQVLQERVATPSGEISLLQ